MEQFNIVIFNPKVNTRLNMHEDEVYENEKYDGKRVEKKEEFGRCCTRVVNTSRPIDNIMIDFTF